MSFNRTQAAFAIAVFLLVGQAEAQTVGRYKLGHVADPGEIAAWDIDVRGDGTGLPAGSGNIEQGKAIFAESCAACHGDKGQGAIGDILVGGKGTLNTAKPIKTIGSFWPYAPTLYDYVSRAMPFNAPQSLTPSQVYAVTAYLLFLNGILPESAKLDASSLSRIEMPNRGGFTSDPRPDVPPPAASIQR
ncbi:mono/diheme cytochrome c family protein [Bradyrhizobium sp. AZCC 2262]|uniref:c-type cytochrome n=1 Tax=Bradyrhizobium sp. AZCC 2262 TaxID=3117022 RepID=UPI002FF076B7